MTKRIRSRSFKKRSKLRRRKTKYQKKTKIHRRKTMRRRNTLRRKAKRTYRKKTRKLMRGGKPQTVEELKEELDSVVATNPKTVEELKRELDSAVATKKGIVNDIASGTKTYSQDIYKSIDVDIANIIQQLKGLGDYSWVRAISLLSSSSPHKDRKKNGRTKMA